MVRRIEGDVQMLHCTTCKAAFPTFVFSGDTDMVTMGLVAATAPASGLLALGEATGLEIRSGYDGAHEQFARRVSGELKQPMSWIKVVRYESRSTQTRSASFKDFQAAYAPPEAVYACPTCGSEARIESTLSAGEFERSGGRLVLCDDLTL